MRNKIFSKIGVISFNIKEKRITEEMALKLCLFQFFQII